MSNLSFTAQFNNNINHLQQQQLNNNIKGRTTPNFMQKQQKAARVNNIFNKLVLCTYNSKK